MRGNHGTDCSSGADFRSGSVSISLSTLPLTILATEASAGTWGMIRRASSSRNFHHPASDSFDALVDNQRIAAQLMDRKGQSARRLALCEHLFSGAGFPINHHGGIIPRHLFTLLTALREKRPSFLSVMIGFLGGLVAVTPAAGVTNAGGALILSLLVSILCYFCINIARPRLGFDDAFDVWGLHGMGGLTGTILLPLFADPALVEFSGGMGTQLGVQAVCAVIAAGFSFAVSWGLLKLIGLVTPLRLPEATEGNVDEIVYQEFMQTP